MANRNEQKIDVTNYDVDKKGQSKKQNKLKKIVNNFFEYNPNNLKLWLALASIPFAIVFCIYLYGNSNLDKSIIKEGDEVIINDTQNDNIDFKEKKVDFSTQISRKMQLPTPKVIESNTTTKEDKRLLDHYGNMVTMEVQSGQSLESLAQNKFGNKAFWVYIFDVNRDKLNTPADAKPGMKLYVPNPEYFGFSANDASSVQYAKHRATEILGEQQ